MKVENFRGMSKAEIRAEVHAVYKAGWYEHYSCPTELEHLPGVPKAFRETARHRPTPGCAILDDKFDLEANLDIIVEAISGTV